MPDLKSVIKGLECCTNQSIPKCEQCPYAYHCEEWDTWVIKADALALLKEQDAVRPVKQIEQTEWTVCGNCRNHIISKWIFCPNCGKPIL